MSERSKNKAHLELFNIFFDLGKPLIVFILPQGILLEHREIEFGDKVNAEDVLRAARRVGQELLPLGKK